VNTPKLLIPPYDAIPGSRQTMAMTAIILDGVDGHNIANLTVIGAGSSVLTPIFFSPGFDHIEVVARVGDLAPNTSDCAVDVVICDERQFDISTENIGQLGAGPFQSVLRCEFPGLYLWRLKFSGVGGPTRISNLYWIKLSKR
jgi:hypothetical protein